MRILGALLTVIWIQGPSALASEPMTLGSPFESFGGVGIGNGGRVFAGMDEGHFANEQMLFEKVEETVRLVNSGTHPRVRQWIQQGNCKPQMKFPEDGDIGEIYISYKNVNGSWEKGVSGYTTIQLQDCRSPFNIEADEGPTGPDDTDIFNLLEEF